MKIKDKTKEFDRPKFCESYYAYKKFYLEENNIGFKYNDLLKALYIRDGFNKYHKLMWENYIDKIAGQIKCK